MLVKEDYNGYKIEYIYDNSNKLIKINEPYFGTTGSSSEAIITYNAAGKIDEIVKNQNGSLSYKSKTKYTYNFDGTLQKKETFKFNFLANNYRFESSSTYSYALNKVIENILFNLDKSRKIYDYSISKNLIKITNYDDVTDANPSGNLSYEISYSDFDDKNYSKTSLPEEYKFPQTFKNNYQKEATNTINFEYNPDGYPIKSTIVGGLGFTKYEYLKAK